MTHHLTTQPWPTCSLTMSWWLSIMSSNLSHWPCSWLMVSTPPTYTLPTIWHSTMTHLFFDHSSWWLSIMSSNLSHWPCSWLMVSITSKFTPYPPATTQPWPTCSLTMSCWLSIMSSNLSHRPCSWLMVSTPPTYTLTHHQTLNHDPPVLWPWVGDSPSWVQTCPTGPVAG